MGFTIGGQGSSGVTRYSAELTSAATYCQLTGLSGLDISGGRITCETNAGTNLIGISINGEMVTTGYTHSFCINGVGYAGQPNDNRPVGVALSSGTKFFLVINNISRVFDGTNTTIEIAYQSDTSAYQFFGRIQRVLSGNVTLNSIEVWSNQTNGLKSGAKITLWAE